ncbi:hypothetical protein K439DRAFT_647605 [Ramaria rubella]|nr:hypothetical protein K439DRAFT_647605 [Ramaria rubella]
MMMMVGIGDRTQSLVQLHHHLNKINPFEGREIVWSLHLCCRQNRWQWVVRRSGGIIAGAARMSILRCRETKMPAPRRYKRRTIISVILRVIGAAVINIMIMKPSGWSLVRITMSVFKNIQCH